MNHKLQIGLSWPNKDNFNSTCEEIKQLQIYATTPKRLFKDTRSVEIRRQYKFVEGLPPKINRVILQHMLVRKFIHPERITNWMGCTQIQKEIMLIQKTFLDSMQNHLAKAPANMGPSINMFMIDILHM